MKRSGLPAMAMVAAAAVSMAAAARGGVAVKDVTARQRYPWNGMVDIDYTVECDDPAADVWVYPTGMNRDTNVSLAPRALTGDGAGGPVKAGRHRMTWDAAADYPGLSCEAFTVTMTALTGGAPYMVVDLSGGVDALSYPVSYLPAVPAGGWTDKYKTTNLVLRLVAPGTFRMGSPTDEWGRKENTTHDDEDLHSVTLTKPFYIGVFEVTRKQWELVMGKKPSYNGRYGYNTDDRCPAEGLGYDDIRGSVNGAGWPKHDQVDANSFMGRLRSKVNQIFDLPTEAQWEYACRAGTGSALNSGKNLPNWQTCPEMDEVGRYQSNSGGSRSRNVGSYRPNAWGLYDMHGNVSEWCRDWYQKHLGTNTVTDPVGPASGGYRALRGGDYYNLAGGCRSACRSGGGYEGFRPVCFAGQ